jgi:hypothetical protein
MATTEITFEMSDLINPLIKIYNVGIFEEFLSICLKFQNDFSHFLY